MICRHHVMSAITWLKTHNSHYRDIKLNEHWYSDIAVGELSLQLDESDNHITMNEDIVHKQSLNTADISKRDTKQRGHSGTIHNTDRIYKCR